MVRLKYGPDSLKQTQLLVPYLMTLIRIWLLASIPSISLTITNILLVLLVLLIGYQWTAIEEYIITTLFCAGQWWVFTQFAPIERSKRSGPDIVRRVVLYNLRRVLQVDGIHRFLLHGQNSHMSHMSKTRGEMAWAGDEDTKSRNTQICHAGNRFCWKSLPLFYFYQTCPNLTI